MVYGDLVTSPTVKSCYVTCIGMSFFFCTYMPFDFWGLSVVDVDSWKNPGCSTCSVRWVDAVVSVVVSSMPSSVTSSVPFSSSSSTSSIVVVGCATSGIVVLAGGWTVVVVVDAELVVLAEVVVIDGRGGWESYRFSDDSSLRRFQTPPSMSLVSISERNTDMWRCSPYMRFIRPWFSKTNRRTACL